MKFFIILSAVFIMVLSGCRTVPPGQAKGCGHGPGKSESAPGQIKKNCR